MRSGPVEGWGQCWAGDLLSAAAAWEMVTTAGFHWQKLEGRQLGGGLAAASGPKALSVSEFREGRFLMLERSCFHFLCPTPTPSLITEPRGLGAGVLVQTGYIFFVSL